MRFNAFAKTARINQNINLATNPSKHKIKSNLPKGRANGRF